MNTYNDKIFIAPNSINSMSAIHCKIYNDGKAIIRLSDCHNSIRWHNDILKPEELEEMIEKLTNANAVIQSFISELKNRQNK